MKQTRQFTGVFMPAHILEDKDLTAAEKMVYADVASFGEFFKSNARMAVDQGLSESQIKRILGKLKDKGYLKQVSFNGRTRVLKALYDKPDSAKVSGQTAHRCAGRQRIGAPADSANMRPIDNKLDNKLDNNLETKAPAVAEATKAVVIPAELVEPFELANLLAARIKENYTFKNATPKQTEGWAQEIERLHRIDGKDYAVIKAVIDWSQQDEFWRQNIQSGSTLRKQFDKLLIRIKEEQNRRGRNLTVIS